VTDNYGIQISSCIYLRVASDICTSSGDPHFNTFDDDYLSFQGIGDFYLIKSAPINITSRYQICYDGADVTCNRAIGVVTPDVKITSYFTPDPTATFFTVSFFINGETVLPLSGTVPLPGNSGSVIFQNDTGYSYLSFDINLINSNSKITVDMIDYYANVAVGLNGAYNNIITGFCGNFNNNPDDDTMFPNGTLVDPDDDDAMIALGEFYRVLQGESPFDYNTAGSNYGQVNVPVTSYPTTLTITNADLNEQAQTVCGSFNLTADAYQACLFDVAAAGNIDAASASGLNAQKKCYETTGNNACLANTLCPNACSFRGTCVNGVCKCITFLLVLIARL